MVSASAQITVLACLLQALASLLDPSKFKVIEVWCSPALCHYSTLPSASHSLRGDPVFLHSCY